MCEAIESPWRSSFFIDTAEDPASKLRSERLMETLDQLESYNHLPRSGTFAADDWPTQREGPDPYQIISPTSEQYQSLGDCAESVSGTMNALERSTMAPEPATASRVTLPPISSLMLPLPISPVQFWLGSNSIFSPLFMFNPFLGPVSPSGTSCAGPSAYPATPDADRPGDSVVDTAKPIVLENDREDSESGDCESEEFADDEREDTIYDSKCESASVSGDEIYSKSKSWHNWTCGADAKAIERVGALANKERVVKLKMPPKRIQRRSSPKHSLLQDTPKYSNLLNSFVEVKAPSEVNVDVKKEDMEFEEDEDPMDPTFKTSSIRPPRRVTGRKTPEKPKTKLKPKPKPKPKSASKSKANLRSKPLQNGTPRKRYEHIWGDQRKALINDLTQIGFNVLRTEDGASQCSVCNATFSSRMFATRHAQREHLGKKPYQCKSCSLGFARNDTLLRHMKKYHGMS